VQIHDLTLDWRACGVGPETIDLNTNPMCFAVQDAFNCAIYSDYFAVNRTDHTQWRGWNYPPWVAKQQVQGDEKQASRHCKYEIQIAHRRDARRGNEQQEWNAFLCDKRVSSSFHEQRLIKTAATILCFAVTVNTAWSH
jgi:hypothetical protein